MLRPISKSEAVCLSFPPKEQAIACFWFQGSEENICAVLDPPAQPWEHLVCPQVRALLRQRPEREMRNLLPVITHRAGPGLRSRSSGSAQLHETATLPVQA